MNRRSDRLARYRAAGPDGLKPKSKRPRSSPTRVPSAVEEEIVALRKTLSDQGLDAGAHTIAYHLTHRRRPHRTPVPSVATIWRVLARRGFVTPQPHKRPRSSWRRFCAELPNECWQGDTTHWPLADDTDAEILNLLDDNARLLTASRAFLTTKATDVLDAGHGTQICPSVPFRRRHWKRLRLTSSAREVKKAGGQSVS